MTLQLAVLVARAFCALIHHELTRSAGFGHIERRLARVSRLRRPSSSHRTTLVCEAVNLACCFYFKPVRCLQKSVVTVRLLRGYGVDARLVVGYRLSPFFSHAWVEVEGRVVNDSPAYKDQLKVLWSV